MLCATILQEMLASHVCISIMSMERFILHNIVLEETQDLQVDYEI